MGERVDLDRLEGLARAGLAAEDLEEAQRVALAFDELGHWQTLLALVAEVRAGRELAETADSLRSFLPQEVINALDDLFAVQAGSGE